MTRLPGGVSTEELLGGGGAQGGDVLQGKRLLPARRRPGGGVRVKVDAGRRLVAWCAAEQEINNKRQTVSLSLI